MERVRERAQYTAVLLTAAEGHRVHKSWYTSNAKEREVGKTFANMGWGGQRWKQKSARLITETTQIEEKATYKVLREGQTGE